MKSDRARTYKEWLQYGASRLAEAGVLEDQLDARYLLLEAFRLDQVHFLLCGSQIPEGIEAETCIRRYEELIEKRMVRIPLQQLTGVQDFMGLTFAVNPWVLIPRQDTETLVELVLKEQKNQKIRLLDMCTGSGCIAVSLKKYGQYEEVTGADISADALRTALENGKANGCDVTWLESDLFHEIKCGETLYDVIVSNPPYIPTADIAKLEPEVRDYEPFAALDGREDGLYFYQRLAAECTSFLKCGGRVYFEIGYDQAKAVSKLLEEAGFTDIIIVKDQPGLDRVVRAVWNNQEVTHV